MLVILPKKIDSDEDIVDIPEYEGIFLRIAVLLLEEGNGMISPVTAGVEMVRGVVTVIERESITLWSVSGGFGNWEV